MKLSTIFWKYKPYPQILIGIVIVVATLSLLNKCDSKADKQTKQVIQMLNDDIEKVKIEKDSIDFQLKVLKAQRKTTRDSIKQSEYRVKLLNMALKESDKEKDRLNQYILKTPPNMIYSLLDTFYYPFFGEKIYPFNAIQIKNIFSTKVNYDIALKDNNYLSKKIDEFIYQIS